MSWMPTWVFPTFRLLEESVRKAIVGGYKLPRACRSCFPALFFELYSYTFLMEFIHKQGEQWSSGILWPERVQFALEK